MTLIDSVATVVRFTTYSVGCVKSNGREVSKHFADLTKAEAFFNGAVFSGNYACIVLTGWNDSGDFKQLDVWMN